MHTAKKIRRVLFLSIAASAAVVAAAGTPALVNWWNNEPEQPVEEKADKIDPAQKALAGEMMHWLQPFDSTNTSYYLNGYLTAVDRADSANALLSVPYTICKAGNELYVRMGQTETVNDQSSYCYADHAAKRILLSSPRSVLLQSGLPGRELYKYIREEGYTFTKTQNGTGRWTIKMENPKHIARKEFTVQYDSVSSSVSQIFIRHADVSDPMNPGKEKWITLIINEWNDDPDPQQYINVKKFVRKKGDMWECAPAYENYDLITR